MSSAAKMKKRSEETSKILKMLAHPKRLLMLCALVDGPKNVGEITEICHGGQSEVSQALIKMRQLNLLKSQKTAQFVEYEIKDLRIKKLIKTLYEIFCSEVPTSKGVRHV